jgi:hypothetical protein
LTDIQELWTDSKLRHVIVIAAIEIPATDRALQMLGAMGDEELAMIGL